MFIKQSTAYTYRIGPFVDENDGKTAETGLSIGQADIRISKSGGDFAQRNASSPTNLTHDESGYYILVLDTTDTSTVGPLTVAVHESGALPVWNCFQVVEESIYASLFAASAAGFNSSGQVAVNSLTSAAITDVWSTDALVEAYANDGSAGTAAQMLYMLWAAVNEFNISGTTITAKKLDGSTTAMTWTLDSASSPTSRTRAS